MSLGTETKIYHFGTHSLEVPQRYEVVKMVGTGAYGIVCSAVDTLTGEKVAIKKIARIFDDLVDGKRIVREVKMLSFLHHPNVLSLKDMFKPKDPDHFTDLYFVTDLMDTDLFQLLKSKQARLLEEHCQYLVHQLLCGLMYIHSAGIIHRDLKPANLLTNAECDLKICDFGLARGVGTHMTDYVVTRWYRPPELLLVSDDYDAAVDMWGVGCLAVEMLTRKPLFAGRDYIHQINLITDVFGIPKPDDLPTVKCEEALRYIRSMPAKPKIGLQVKMAGASLEHIDFVEKLLVFDPRRRFTAKQALAHPWLQRMNDCDGHEEVTSREQFHWEHDHSEMSAPLLRQLLWEEIHNNSKDR